MEIGNKFKQSTDVISILKNGWKNKWKFEGCASRAEFWWNILALTGLAFFADLAIIIGVGLLSMSIPSLPMPQSDWIVMGVVKVIIMIFLCGLISRRLHDTQHSNWTGISMVVLTPLAFFCSIFIIVIICPGIIDNQCHWTELITDFRVVLTLCGSMFVCAVYITLLAYVTPLLFKRGITAQ